MDRDIVNHNVYVRRRSRGADIRPALMWFVITFLLLVNVGILVLIVRALAGDWLDLKMESARVRVMEMLPQPERPEFVPTPILIRENAAAPTIAWNKNMAERGATPTSQPTETPRVEYTPSALSPPTEVPSVAPTPTESIVLNSIQPAVQLTGVIPEAQRFNNCGPTTLRMYLSYFGFTKETQVQIAQVVKPYGDDRNVSPDELAAYAESKGFHALVRVNGNLDRIKQILSNGLPVMIEEGYDPPRAHQGWMGHYLLITGYDEQGITAQDSYNGPNQHVTWSDLDDHWRDFNRTYLLFYPDAQQEMVQTVIGEDMDDATMYAKAAQRAQDELAQNPNDAFAAFNLGSSLVGLGEYDAAANAFDRSRVLKLPWRMMWYQFGPFEAYYRVGRYDEVIALANATLKPTGDLEESYYYKGLALQELGRTDEARAAFQMALKFNAHYAAAQLALKQL